MSYDKEYLFENKNGVWYYNRKIPIDVTRVFGGRKVMKSLKTKNRAVAVEKARRMNELYEDEWAHLLSSGGENPTQTHKLAVRQAQNLNVRYFTSQELLVSGKYEDVINRLSFLEKEKVKPESLVMTALVGSVSKPVMKISNAEDLFFDKIMAQRKISLSSSKYRVWKNRYLRVIKKFIELNGDLLMTEIERHHGVALYDYWLKRVMPKKGKAIKPATASKELGTISSFYNSYFKHVEGVTSDRINPFRGLYYEDLEEETRSPFPLEAIQEMISSDKLLKLNFEARMIFLAFIDTGARPTELCGLEPEDIVLNTDVPYIDIVPRATRGLKTRVGSKRKVPLVGVALEAFKKFPKGFKRYKFNEMVLCAVAGKFIKMNEFKTSDDLTFYSIRHSFVDRMEMNGMEQEFRHRMVGHKLSEQEYGKGGSLKFKRDKLKAIELDFNKKLFKRN